MSRKRERSEDIPLFTSKKQRSLPAAADRDEQPSPAFSFSRNQKPPTITIEEQITQFLHAIKEVGKNAGDILNRIGAGEAKPKPQKQTTAPRITVDAEDDTSAASSSDSDTDSGAESRHEEEGEEAADVRHTRSKPSKRNDKQRFRREKTPPSPPPSPKPKPKPTRSRAKPKPARSAETDGEQEDAGFYTDADTTRGIRRSPDNNALAAFKKGGKLDDKINKLVLAYIESVVYLLLAPFFDQALVRRQVAKHVMHASVTHAEKERLEKFFTEIAHMYFPQTASIQRSEIVNVMAIFAPGLANEQNRDTSIAIWNQIKFNAERLQAQAISDEELAHVWHPRHSAELAEGLPNMLFFLSNPAAFVSTIFALSWLYQKQVKSTWNPFCGEDQHYWTNFALSFSDPERPDNKKFKFVPDDSPPHKVQALESHQKISYRFPAPFTMAEMATEKAKNSRDTTILSFPPRRIFSLVYTSEETSGAYPIAPPRLDMALVFPKGSADLTARWMTSEERGIERLPIALMTAYFKGFFEKDRTATINAEEGVQRVPASSLDALYKKMLSNPDAKVAPPSPAEEAQVNANTRNEERNAADLAATIKSVADLSELPSDPISNLGLEEGEDASGELPAEVTTPTPAPAPQKKSVTIAPTPEKVKKPALKTPATQPKAPEKRPSSASKAAASNGKNHGKSETGEQEHERLDFDDDDYNN